MATLRIELLGGFGVSVDGHAVDDAAWRRRKPAALIKLLALAPAHRLHREQAMDLLWPELDPEAAGANLRKALYYARRALDGLHGDEGSLIAFDGELLAFATRELWIDVETFRTSLAAARRGGDVDAYQAAVELYRGDLLPDDLYEEWAEGARTELQLELLAALEELTGLLEARGALAGAIVAARRLVAADPLREESHVTLIRLCALAGRRNDALRQYEHLVQIMDRELGAEPGPEAQQLHEEIRARQAGEPELTGDLWERVGDLRMLSGDGSGAAKAFASALKSAPDVDQARLERKCAEAWLMQHRADAAAQHLAAAEAREADPVERGRLLRALANHAWESGDIAAARRYAEQARDAALAHGTADDLAAAQEALAIVSHFSGAWREGLDLELARLVGDGGDPGHLARVFDIHHCIGQFHLYGDGLAGSVEGYARRLLDQAEEFGAVRAQAFAWCLLGESLLLGAHWEEADGCLARSCELHASLGSRSGALPWQRRAELAVCRGAHGEAEGYLREASAISTVSPMARHLWGRIYATAAFAAVERAEPDQAVRAVRAAASAAVRYGDCPTCSALLNPVAAEAFALLGDADSARLYAAAADGVSRMFESAAWRAMAESAAGSVALVEGDERAAAERFEAAHTLYQRAGQSYWAERSLRLASGVSV